MDWEKCEVLLTVLEEGSLTAAAEKLAYTPSGISRMVAALEKEAGFHLLLRGREGVRPTRECEMLLPTVRELTYWGRRFEEQAKGIRGIESGTVRVGTAYEAFYPWLTETMAHFTKEHPGIQLDMMEGTSSDLTGAMAERKCDFCMVSRRPGNFRFQTLLWDELMVILPKNHPLVSRQEIPLREVEKEPYIEFYPGRRTDNAILCERYQIKPVPRFSTTDLAAGFSMVEAGLGIALANRLIAGQYQDKVAARRLKPRRFVEIGFAWPEEDNISPAAKAFAEYAMTRTGIVRDAMGEYLHKYK